MTSIDLRIEKCRQIIIQHFLEEYSSNEEIKKMTRDFYYDFVYRSGLKYTGYMSNNAFVENSDFTDDHYLSPRLMISAVLEKNIQILFSKNQFSEIFLLSMETVRVSKKQNHDVKYENKNKKIEINELTVDKYDKFSPWWNNELIFFKEFPLKNKIPSWFTEYEKMIIKTT